MSAAFTVREFLDLVTALERHPEWRQELRRLLLTDDILTLPQAVRELIEAQKHTDQAIRELVEAQRRGEEEFRKYREASEERFAGIESALKALAEAQRRTEMRVEELAEAQRRTEMRVEELAEAQKRTEQRLSNVEGRLGRLERIVGVTVEEEAADVLRVVMEDKGYRVRGEPVYWRPDGEVDVILPVEDLEGRHIHVVLEAKVRLGRRAVEDWVNRMRSEGFRSRLARSGFDAPYLIYVYGIRADTSAEHAARTFGIGLLTPRGELLSPKGLE